MKKIISLFQRNYDGDRQVRDEVVPGAEWVIAGEGVATRKFDGACCMVEGGKLFKRYDLPLLPEWAKKKKEGFTGPWSPAMFKEPPAFWRAAETEPDQNSGHWPGWLPVGDKPEDEWFRVAFDNARFQDETPTEQNRPLKDLPDGTYEAVGPHFQGNPEGYLFDTIQRHGWHKLSSVPRTFVELRQYFITHCFEGVVWHHPDGRMVKIKAKDFGIKRNAVRVPKREGEN